MRKQSLNRDHRLFTLEILIVSGPISAAFARKNKVISRTIEIRGDQTLDDLHETIFDAFDRDDEHLYEFQIGGKGPMDPKAARYTLPLAMDDIFPGSAAPSGDATRAAVGTFGLKVGDTFGYWFDFGDDWMHQVKVQAIAEAAPKGKFPRVTQRVGKSPPQYPE